MGVLRNFESRLERGIEGFFTKAFRSGLQPIELAKRILREMDAHKTVSVREVWVPNRYVLRISEEDRARFENMEGALARELETVVTEGARERGWGLVARPEVVFETAERMKRGDLKVVAELTEETGPAPAEAPRPAPSPAPPTAAPSGPARLILDGREVALDRDKMVIGRLHGSEIEIEDPGASRRHAEIRKDGDRFVLVDLGSTNGTLVNDSPVGEHSLEDGDRITIGRTVLEFRRG
jgi:FHA domain-containing protein